MQLNFFSKPFFQKYIYFLIFEKYNFDVYSTELIHEVFLFHIWASFISQNQVIELFTTQLIPSIFSYIKCVVQSSNILKIELTCN